MEWSVPLEVELRADEKAADLLVKLAKSDDVPTLRQKSELLAESFNLREYAKQKREAGTINIMYRPSVAV